MAPELMCRSAFLALPLTDSELSGGLHRHWLMGGLGRKRVLLAWRSRRYSLRWVVHASEEVVAFAAFVRMERCVRYGEERPIELSVGM